MTDPEDQTGTLGTIVALTRRDYAYSSVMFAAALFALDGSTALAQTETVQDYIEDFSKSEDLSASNHAFREFAENFPSLRLERAPVKLKPSSIAISNISRQLILSCEVSSESLYNKRYQSPVWPGGQSGVTIGIGYDIGYVSHDELREDWGPHIADKDIDKLSIACGVTNEAAKEVIREFADIQIPYNIAEAEFVEELARYVALTVRHIPNFTDLSEDSRGALVSLVHNRGPSFDAPGSRYSEMRNIKNLMLTKNYPAIPAEIRGMERLWPGVAGLIKRREAEAVLFERGLN